MSLPGLARRAASSPTLPSQPQLVSHARSEVFCREGRAPSAIGSPGLPRPTTQQLDHAWPHGGTLVENPQTRTARRHEGMATCKLLRLKSGHRGANGTAGHSPALERVLSKADEGGSSWQRKSGPRTDTSSGCSNASWTNSLIWRTGSGRSRSKSADWRARPRTEAPPRETRSSGPLSSGDVRARGPSLWWRSSGGPTSIGWLWRWNEPWPP